MELFPEVGDATTMALSALNINSQYPFSTLFTLLGFFMVLSVEQAVHICHKRNRSSGHLRSSFNEASSTETAAPHLHNHSHGLILPSESDSVGAGSGSVTASTFRIMLLLIALSVHSVFEGLAVGLQRSVAEVVTLFTALLLHKLIMAVSIGVSLATTREHRAGGIVRSQWVGTLAFALASPIGVLIGWALIAQRSSPGLLMAIAVLQGLACGTFFFVVFCEMLPHEFSETESETTSGVNDRLGKIISLLLGFVLIATYIAFEEK